MEYRKLHAKWQNSCVRNNFEKYMLQVLLKVHCQFERNTHDQLLYKIIKVREILIASFNGLDGHC